MAKREYIYGRRKELQVGEFLEKRGFEWQRSPGSKGPIDLLAKKGVVTLAIQVKATRKNYTSYTKLTIDEENRLKEVTKRTNATPALALALKNYLWLVTIPNDKVILEGELNPLEYDYDNR